MTEQGFNVEMATKYTVDMALLYSIIQGFDPLPVTLSIIKERMSYYDELKINLILNSMKEHKMILQDKNTFTLNPEF